MSCSCAATPRPPCGFCENSFICDGCQTQTVNMEACTLGGPDKSVFCASCYEGLTSINEKSADRYRCVCSLDEMMNSGCQCGGV